MEYTGLVNSILENGVEVDSRFGKTKELTTENEFSFVAGEILHRRGNNLQIGWCETVQLAGGIYDPDSFRKYAPNSPHSLFTRAMAYGPRTVGTIEKLIYTLANDHNNRQAYAHIGRPGEEGSENLPCTLGLHFLRRGQYLTTVAHMRSLDVLKGLPVDVMMFGAMTQIIANCLGLVAGEVTIKPSSAHVYLADVEQGKLPAVPGRKRSFTMPYFTAHKDYVKWALEQSDWHWDSVPDGITINEDTN